MRTLTLATLALFAVTAFGQAVRVPKQSGGEAADALYSSAYNPQNLITVTGTVTGKIKGTANNGYAEGMSILVKTRSGKVYSVDLGPAWYVAAQAAKVNMGDRVRVVGSPVVINGKEHVLLAKQIIRGHQILALRDESGLPFWSALRRGRYTVPGYPNQVTGTIVSVGPVQAEGTTQVGYELKTDMGLMNVAVAPSWYLEQQGIGFKPGDNVTIFTGPTPAAIGSNVIMAGGVYSPALTNTMLLRQYGLPMWSGWQNYNGPTP